MLHVMLEGVPVAQAGQRIVARMLLQGGEQVEALDGGGHELADGGKGRPGLFHAAAGGVLHFEEAGKAARDHERRDEEGCDVPQMHAVAGMLPDAEPHAVKLEDLPLSQAGQPVRIGGFGKVELTVPDLTDVLAHPFMRIAGLLLADLEDGAAVRFQKEADLRQHLEDEGMRADGILRQQVGAVADEALHPALPPQDLPCTHLRGRLAGNDQTGLASVPGSNGLVDLEMRIEVGQVDLFAVAGRPALAAFTGGYRCRGRPCGTFSPPDQLS